MHYYLKYLTIFCICFIPALASAGFDLYSIDGIYSAPFPARPVFNGEAGSGKGTHRGYKYDDNKNKVLYLATYQVNKSKFDIRVLDKALNNYVKGLILGSKHNLIEYTQFIHSSNNRAAKYVSRLDHPNFKILRYGLVIYKDGRFHGWSVTEIAGISLLSAKNIFDYYQKYIEMR